MPARAKLTLFILLFASSSRAVLSSGQIQLRQDLWYMTAYSYWIGSDLRLYDGGKGKCQAFAESTTASFGVGRGWQVDTRVAYQKNELVEGSFFRRGPGQSISGISEISFRVQKEIWSGGENGSELSGILGVRVPGNPYSSPDDFLAVSDGAAKLDLGLQAYVVFELFAISASLRHSFRSSPSNDQIALDTQFPFSLSSGFQLGPSLTLLHTWKGIDINGPEFLAISDELGGGHHLPFPRAKEQVVAVGAFLTYAVDEALSLDLAFQSKVWGRNTDKGSNLTLGVNYIF